MVDFNLILGLILIQACLGAFDTLWHHEITEGLPGRITARREIALHGARELIYGVIFLLLALAQPNGALAWVFAGLLAVEVVITLVDFIEEDRTRSLPAAERVLHTIMAMLYGGILILLWPHLLIWAEAPTGLVMVDRGLFTIPFILFGLGVLAWGGRDLLAWYQLGRAAPVLPDAMPPSGRTILITGATGFLGTKLVMRRLTRGDRVVVLTRDRRKAKALFADTVSIVDQLDDIASQTRIDAVINLAGANVADRPWWPARRRVLLDSRVDTTRAVGRLITRLDTPPDALINASAVGAYGDGGETVLNEHAARPLGVFTADLCRVWETEADLAGLRAGRVAKLRFGLVLGLGGGALPRMIMARPFGVVPQFGNGRQWMPWVHVTDALDVLERAIEDDRMTGPINVVAPTQTPHGAVIRTLAGRRLRPLIPAFALRTALGEMAELFLASQRVRPGRLLALDHTFRFPTIEDAAADFWPATSQAKHEPSREAEHGHGA